MLRFIVLFTLSLNFISCSKKKHHEGGLEQVFVKGDPANLIADTSRNTVSFLTLANMVEFNDFKESSAKAFSEKTFIKKNKEEDDDDDEDKDDNKGDQACEGDAKEAFSFKAYSDQQYVYKNCRSNYSLIFKSTSTSNLELVEFNYRNANYPVRVDHYSISPDKRKFSFLFTIKDKSYGNILVNTVFIKSPLFKTRTLKFVSKAYNYLMGQGIVSSWTLDSQKSVNLTVCPSMTRELGVGVVSNAIKVWEQPFKEQSLNFNINLKFPSSCAPFSDVNQNAIFWIKKYLTVYSKDESNMGVTFFDIDSSTGEILLSNVFVLEAELNKLKNFKSVSKTSTFMQDMINRTITHEMGHFLGLGHNFDDSASVMSYEDVNELGSYDKNAIRELYRDQL